MTDRDSDELMRTAWATRRASFGASPERRDELLAKAREDLLTAASQCRAENSPVARAQALHLLANVEHDMHDDEQARAHWEESIAILRGTDEVLQLAHKVRHLGDLHRHCRRLPEAAACYDEAIALYREHDRPGSLDFANAVRRVALLREQMGDRESAVAAWEEAGGLYRAAEAASGTDLSAGVEESERHVARLRG